MLTRTLAISAALVVAAASVEAQPSLVTDARPVVRIGTEGGTEPYVFSGVAGALRRSDGSIVVANCGSSELRFYDAAGRYLRSAGGRGAGPGEFQYLRRIFHAGGDSIGAFDGIPQLRFSLFGADGRIVRSFGVPFRIEVIGRMASGDFVGRSGAQPPREPGVHRRVSTIFRLDGSGTVVDSLSGLLGQEVEVVVGGRPTRAVRLGRTAVFAVLQDRVVVGTQDGAALTDYDVGLHLLRRMSTITQPEPVTQAVRERWDSARDLLTPNGGVIPAYGTEYAPSMPAYRDLVAGRDGRVWVQDPVRPGVYPLVWTAYRDGHADARLELPPRFFPTDFGSDWVLGVAFDELGVERIEVRRMRPGAVSTAGLPPRDAQPPELPRCGTWTSR